jgi:hypothetical protein
MFSLFQDVLKELRLCNVGWENELPFAEVEIVWMEMVIIYFKVTSREHSVDIATGHGFVGQDSIPGKGKRFISTPQ